jgi:hypothetical protein
MYEGLDYTQNVYYGVSRLASDEINGKLSVSFIANDWQTKYSVYVEAY